MDLCLALGWRSLDEMYDGMTAQEFSLWQRKCLYSPLPIKRADYHAAMIAQNIVNMAGRIAPDNFTLDKFMLFDKEPDEVVEADPAEHLKQFK